MSFGISLCKHEVPICCDAIHLLVFLKNYTKVITLSELIKSVKAYNPDANVDMIRKAYMFVFEAHDVQERASGSAYFHHPAEVARLLAEMRLDVPSIVTGLLHDVIEDTSISLEELEEVFGTEIAFLVSGVSKLSKVNFSSFTTHQSENLRKFILATTKDLRVLIVKLADRLHNMRTINYISSIEKRKKIALETLEIYAPLAEKIGMTIIRDDMEELAFYTLHPNEYRAIDQRLEELKSKDEDFIKKTIAGLERVFKESDLDARISGREKKAYSIWKKMQRTNVPLAQINDIIAFRVIVKNVKDCYAALGVIHTNFLIMPGRFKDYISIPKLNNYRSLHTTVIGPLKQRVEIQIRTEEMHRIADSGAAAHWAYKDGEVVTQAEKSTQYNWFKGLLSVMENSKTPEEMMENAKIEILSSSEIFCFTPTGELTTIQQGATVVDFAYEIHTSVGNALIGAKINGNVVPLNTVLRNGDQVDIITSLHQRPETSWNKVVSTVKAKSSVKKFVKSQNRTEFALLGKKLVDNVFSASGKTFSEKMIKYRDFACDSIKRFYYNVGKGIISLDSLQKIAPKNLTSLSEDGICLMGLTPGIAVHFSSCCHPIMGDKIVGIFVPQKGLIVHITSCNNIHIGKNTLVKVRWTKEEDNEDIQVVVRLKISIYNKPTSFAVLAQTISSNGASVTNIKIEHRSRDFFDLLVDITVVDDIQLGEVQAALRTCSNVKSVRRL